MLWTLWTQDISNIFWHFLSFISVIGHYSLFIPEICCCWLCCWFFLTSFLLLGCQSQFRNKCDTDFFAAECIPLLGHSLEWPPCPLSAWDKFKITTKLAVFSYPALHWACDTKPQPHGEEWVETWLSVLISRPSLTRDWWWGRWLTCWDWDWWSMKNMEVNECEENGCGYSCILTTTTNNITGLSTSCTVLLTCATACLICITPPLMSLFIKEPLLAFLFSRCHLGHWSILRNLK